jgi:hypothetical protein
MAVLFIILSFFSTFVFINAVKRTSLISSFIYSLIFISLLILVSTEISSILSIYNFKYLLIFWSITAIILASMALRNKGSLNASKTDFFQLIRRNKETSIGLVSILFILWFQGVVYPPNNWDSMTYHMGRIVHWVANNNVDSYPTHIYRQIYDPPFAEFWIAQVCILSRTDLFANSVQLMFMLGSLATVISICKEFNFTKGAIIISIIFACTTPEILLQSSSTQNDIVTSFFILANILFGIKAYKNGTICNFLFFGMTAGFAILTKGTAYILLLPTFLLFIVFYIKKIIKKSNYVSLLKMTIIPMVIISINFGYYYRNYKLTKDVLGKTNEHYFNESMNAKKAFLLVEKNMGLHWGVFPFNIIVNEIIKESHSVLKEDIKNPENNYAAFSLDSFEHHEDTASNILQVVMIIICLVFFIKCKLYRTNTLFLLLFPFFEFVVFCITLKYQPWHTRLHTPIFFMFAIPIGYIFSKNIENLRFRKVLIKLMLLYGFFIIIVNPTRPFIKCGLGVTNNISIFDTRFDKYLTGRHYYKGNDLGDVKNFIDSHREEKNIGIVMCGDACDTWEYPLYGDIFGDDEKFVAPHLNVSNPSQNAIWNQKFDKTKIKYIVSDTKVDSIEFNDYSYKKEIVFNDFAIYQNLMKK